MLYLLQLLVLWLVAYGLSKCILGLSFLGMSILALVGLSLGWFWANSRLKAWHVVLLAFFLGITGSIFYFANMSQPFIALLKAAWSGVIGLLTRSSSGSPDFSSVNYALLQMDAQLGTFFSRIMHWTAQLRTGQVRQDGLIISLAWSLVFWFASVWAGWWLFRHRSAITSILPAAALLAGALNYIAANPLYLAPLVGLTLIIRAYSAYDLQEQYWIKHKIDFAEDIRFDLNVLVPALALGCMLMALIVPSFSIQQLIRASQQFTQRYQPKVDTIAKSLGLKNQSNVANPFSSLRNPGLPRAHLLGSGPELSKDVVMVISTADYPPAPYPDGLPVKPAQYYWRSLTYDIYTGHGWDTSSVDVTNYSSNQPAIEGFTPITGTFQLVHQNVRFTQDLGGLIYSAGQLISADKDYQVAWRKSPAENSENDQEQIADEFGATIDGNEYKVDSFINNFSLVRLRAPSGEIPTWIQDRYLALPETLPDRVRTLAINLAKDQLTDYDQAAAIETYLRTYTYTLDLPSPPPNRDVVDYFLFDLKRGYCDYYASAMVVMVRALGLPARLVTGYSSGVYDPVNAYYLVTQADAHSWVEIYLAGIGWVEFEPTASLPAILRSSSQSNNLEIPQIRPVQPFTLNAWLASMIEKKWAILGTVVGFLVMGAVLWVLQDDWRLHHLTPSMAIQGLYQRLYKNGQPLAEGLQSGDTPFEFTNRLKHQLKKLAIHHRWKNYFLQGINESDHLTTLYSRVMYSPHAPMRGDQVTAIKSWYHLRTRLWLAAKIRILIHLRFRINQTVNR